MSGHAETVTFNVGGKHYEVSRSLIERFPDTILARMTSELWLGGENAKDEPIFIERDGERFRYCLDYMRDGRVSVPITASKDGIVKDLEYYGFEEIDPVAIEVCKTSREATGSILIDLRQNMAEMELRAVCIRVACDCVNSYLRSGQTVLTMDLKPLEPHYLSTSEIDSDYNRKYLWNNKGKDLLNETLAEFGFQTKLINLRLHSSTCISTSELNVTIEGLKEEA